MKIKLRNKLVSGIKGRYKIDKISAVCYLFDSVCIFLCSACLDCGIASIFSENAGFYSVFITLEIESI